MNNPQSIPQKPQNIHPLLKAEQLYYSRGGLSIGRPLEAATRVAHKFEKAFAEAWGRIPKRHRTAMLKYWGTNFKDPGVGYVSLEQMENARDKKPWEVPKISLVAEPTHHEAGDLGAVGYEGSELEYWAPAVEAMPYEALVSLILLSLAHVYVWTEAVGRPDSRIPADPEFRSNCAYLCLTTSFQNGGYALTNWLKSEEGKRFIAEWDRLLSLMRDCREATIH